MKEIEYSQLPFLNDVFQLTEALQYSCGKEPTTEYEIKNHLAWLTKISELISKKDVLESVCKFKQEHYDELETSPIVLSLLNLYIDSCHADTFPELKAAYAKHQSIQEELSFDDNPEAYFDAGCTLMKKDGKIYIAYPLHLYTAYILNGGCGSDHRGGYFFPNHKLNNEEIQNFYDAKPELFDKFTDLDAILALPENV